MDWNKQGVSALEIPDIISPDIWIRAKSECESYYALIAQLSWNDEMFTRSRKVAYCLVVKVGHIASNNSFKFTTGPGKALAFLALVKSIGAKSRRVALEG